jgi:hypothetical protein
MLLHQLREHFVFVAQFGFKLLDAFLFCFVLGVSLLIES